MTFKQELTELIEKHKYHIPIKAKPIIIAEYVISLLIRLEIFTEHRDGKEE